MKKKINYQKFAKFLLGGMGMLFVICAFFPALSILGGAGLTLAAAAGAQTISGEAATTETIDDAAGDLLRPEISKLITKIRRDVYPLDTIMREIGKARPIDSEEWKYYSKDERGLQDKLNATYAFAGAKSGQLSVDSAHQWATHDTVLIPAVKGGDEKKLRCIVSTVDVALNKITVTPVNGRTAVSATELGDLMPEVPDDTYISRIGNAHGETDAQTDPIEIAPYDTFNYAQIFMAQVEESLVAKKHLKEVDLNIMDYKEDAIIDMRAQAELAMLFGYPKKAFYDPILRKKVNLCGGADYYITKKKEYTKADAITNAIFNAWTKYIFTGNNGSDRRLLFAGNNMLENMMNADIVQKQMEAKVTEVVAGVRFNRIETGFGELLVRRHQAFDEVYGYSDNGLVLDMEHVERGIYESTQVKKLNLDETGQKRVDARRILEHWSMAFKNLDTHCWIVGV
jgi:hypothetical protein